MTLLALALGTPLARGADAPLAVPVEAAPAAPPAVAPAPTAPDLYLQALAAWRTRNPDSAVTLATAAVNTDPLLGEAWLLRGYAHLRLGQPDQALASVRLARESSREDVRAAARALEARLTQVHLRDSPSLYFGLGPQVELQYGAPVPHVAINLGVGVPLWKRVSARAEVRWTALDPGVLGVGGARASALAALTIPLGDSRWALTPSVGPSLWLASGQYWSDGSNPWLGARLDLDVDGRLSPAFGVYLAVGTEVYPGQMAELSWLAEPFDARTGLRFWFWG